MVSTYSLGDSVQVFLLRILSGQVFNKQIQGRPIVGLRLSAGGPTRPLLRPMVKYVGNMHGNELVGREILLALAEHLVLNYGVDERVTRLLNSTEVPSLLILFPESPDSPCAHYEPGWLCLDLRRRGLVAHQEKRS